MAGGAGANRARQAHNQNAGQSQPSGNMSAPAGPAPYDGPASQPSSQHGDSPRENPFGPGLGYDPAKPTPAKPSLITNTRVELPAAAYALDGDVSLIYFGFLRTTRSRFVLPLLLQSFHFICSLPSSDHVDHSTSSDV